MRVSLIPAPGHHGRASRSFCPCASILQHGAGLSLRAPDTIGSRSMSRLSLRRQRRRVSMADQTLTLTLDSGGDVVIKLRPDLAPAHVEQITTLAKQGFYDGVVFHRVIPGFMAQGGDPTGTGMGGSKLPDIKAEFNNEPHTRGACSMARAQSPNSAN